MDDYGAEEGEAVDVAEMEFTRLLEVSVSRWDGMGWDGGKSLRRVGRSRREGRRGLGLLDLSRPLCAGLSSPKD